MTDRLLMLSGEVIRPDGTVAELTPCECIIVGTLWKYQKNHPGELMTRQRMAFSIWGEEYRWPDTWENMIAVRYCGLKKKLAGCSFRFEHKFAFGDRLVGDLEVIGDMEAKPRFREMPV